MCSGWDSRERSLRPDEAKLLLSVDSPQQQKRQEARLVGMDDSLKVWSMTDKYSLILSSCSSCFLAPRAQQKGPPCDEEISLSCSSSLGLSFVS